MNTKTSIVWDNHVCLPLRPGDSTFLPQLERLRASGVDVASINIGYDLTSIEENVRILAHFRHWLQAHSEDYSLVTDVDSIQRAKAQGKLAVTFDLEGGRGLGEQLSLISLYYHLGVRWMLIAYNRNNSLGGGCQDEDSGLNPFGRRVLDEMARVGMVACCSHTGYRTARDVMHYSSKPVIFSHSNAGALREHPRNVPDELIKACAQTGGVMGITGVAVFLGKGNDASVERIVEHIDHAVQLVGPEHVGIGLDYSFDRTDVDEYVRNNPQAFPPELGYRAGIEIAPPECFGSIALRLAARGYSTDAVNGIMGMNFLRVAEEVWR